MHEMTLTLNSPITEEQWDAITDVDFEHINEITFHTKHGKEVKFVKASAQPERLTDDDFETIRIHLSAYKERLCNQHRWKEAEEYQRIIDRFMTFASAQPKKGKWILIRPDEDKAGNGLYECSECGKGDIHAPEAEVPFCWNCGAHMTGSESVKERG